MSRTAFSFSSVAVALAVSASASLVLAACGGGSGSIKHSNMMDKTMAGQNRCTVSKTHDRPFVVEWDATDLASFEAHAQKDVVFVKYVGCEMQVLEQCRDGSLPGAFGTYTGPQFTSGSVEQIDMKDEGELYASLPLGAASLSGRVEAGETLHLRYYVSGVATATRDSVHKKDLVSNAKCKDATHFVSAYNVGAFELSASSRDKESANVGIGRVGGGGSRSHEESSLKHAGKLETCVEHDQSACRAPIRLVLRAIDDGEGSAAAPSAPPASTAGKPDPNEEPSTKAMYLKMSAQKKWEAKDPGGCLADLDRADALDGAHPYRRLRAMCSLLVGKCEEGTKQYRLSLTERDDEKKKSDFEIDKDVYEFVKTFEKCATFVPDPSKKAGNDEISVEMRNACKKNGDTHVTCTMMKRAKAVLDAQAAKKLDECVSGAKEIAAKWSTMPFEQPYTALVLRRMITGAECAASAGKCADAKELTTAWGKAANPGTTTQWKTEGEAKYVKLEACAGK